MTSSVSARSVLRDPSYAVYFGTSFVSNVGTFMQNVGVPFAMFQLTHRNTWVGASVIAVMAPAVLVGPIAGALADRVSRKAILACSNAIQAASALALWILAVEGELTPWRIIGLLVLGGLGSGFQSATAHALVPLIVAPEQLLVAIRLNTLGFNLARVLGPAIAALVLSVWGYRATFALNAASFVVVIVGLLFVRCRRRPRPTVVQRWYRSFAEGVRYVRRHQSLRQLMAFSFVVSWCAMSVGYLAAGLAAQAFHSPSSGLAALVGVFGVGASVCAVVLVVRGDLIRRSRATLVGVVLYGVAILVAVSTPWLAVGLIGFAAMGAAQSMTAVSSNTAIQSQVSDDYRGRVLSMFVLSSLAATPLGALFGGKVADLIGIRVALAIYGAVLLVYAVYAVARLRGFVRFDDVELAPEPDTAPLVPTGRLVPTLGDAGGATRRA